MKRTSAPLKLASNGTRKHIRFRPEPVDVAYLGNVNEAGNFSAFASALVANESMKGCCLILLSGPQFGVVNQGMRLWLKMGEVGPFEAEVRWVQTLDEEVRKIGLSFLET